MLHGRTGASTRRREVDSPLLEVISYASYVSCGPAGGSLRHRSAGLVGDGKEGAADTATDSHGRVHFSPGGSIAITNMTLVSDDGVAAALCMFLYEQPYDCQPLGDNAGATPTQVVSLPDFPYTNTSPFTLTFRLALADTTADMMYVSDGTLRSLEGGSPTQPYSHATLGWTAEATRIIVSINDGSQYPTTDWQPTLGEGNFNATVLVTPPPPTGWTITKIEGYSDDAVPVDATTQTYTCAFHAVITYTGDAKKPDKKIADGYVYLLRPNPSDSWAARAASSVQAPLIRARRVGLQRRPSRRASTHSWPGSRTATATCWPRRPQRRSRSTTQPRTPKTTAARLRAPCSSRPRSANRRASSTRRKQQPKVSESRASGRLLVLSRGRSHCTGCNIVGLAFRSSPRKSSAARGSAGSHSRAASANRDSASRNQRT